PSAPITTVFSSSHRAPLVPPVRPAVVFFALLLLASVPTSEANIRLCGQKLTKTLLAICSGQLCGAYVDSPLKRSVIPAMLSVSTLSDPEYYEVHRMKREAGLATECCQNRCSYSHLKKYCCMN
ncbi:hypothetical protein PENTCL1PPCAC_18408, partial [Pristionchus entomophagus]